MASAALIYVLVACVVVASCDGLLMKNPLCKAPACPANGRHDGILPYYCLGDTVYYECDDGYYLVGEHAWSMCVYDEERGPFWLNAAPICRKRVICGELEDPSYGSVTVTGRVMGSVASYGCDSGYFLDEEDDKRYCLATGLWSGDTPSCKRFRSSGTSTSRSGSSTSSSGTSTSTSTSGSS